MPSKKNGTENPLNNRPRLYSAPAQAGQQPMSGLWAKSKSVLAVRERAVRHMITKARRVMPFLQDCDLPALRGYCELEVVTASIFADIVENGAFQKKQPDEVRRVVNEFRKLRLAMLSYENALGMTPVARAQITGGDATPRDFIAALAQATRIEDNSNSSDTASADNGADGEAG